MPDTFVKIATVTVGAGGANSMEFTSIPSTYTDLCIKISSRQNGSNVDNNTTLQFNGSTTGFSVRALVGTGSTAISFSRTSTTETDIGYSTGANATASTFANTEVYIPNYAGSTNKSLSSDSVAETNATAVNSSLDAGIWANTAAITSIKIRDYQGVSNFVQYSTATLYGISKT
jgi:hypothetical protein